jgi:hypothetical protein
MLVVLHTKSERSQSQRIHLRMNQVAKFGCSDWADYSFVDPMMSEIHFEVCCAPDGCRVRNLSAGSQTLINGKEIGDVATLRHGDEIRAGGTSFAVNIEGDTWRPTETTEADGAAELPPPGQAAQLALLTACVYLELSAEIQEMAKTSADADELIDQLAADEHYLDALRLRGYLLPKRDAVWWGCLCVRDELDEPLPENQLAACAAAVAWVTDPTEARRRDCERASDAAGSNGPGGLLAISAFWSDGSIGPASAPEVPPDERLTCQGLAAALVIAAYLGDSTKVNERMTAFFDKGKQVAAGEIPYPSVEADE